MKAWYHLLIKKTLGKNPTELEPERKREENTPCQRPTPTMDESAGKLRKQFVDFSKSKSKTCIIHGLGNSSDECKVLGEFGTKQAKGKSDKDHGNNLVPRGKTNRQKSINSIINKAVDNILLNEAKKVSAVNHKALEFLKSDYNENDMYQVGK